MDPFEPTTPFYQVSAEKLGKGTGHLIDSEEVTGYVALADASATYRVIYESTSGIGGQVGKPIGVSGMIAFPTTPPVGDGWPVISWAHGTVGSADKCAPSMDSEELGPPGDSGLGLLRMINKAPHKLLNAFLRAGWAVAMTDYEGLGTYGNHPYLLGESEGRGIVDIVPVVSQLAGPDRRISDQYGIVGHSQGGQAALFGAYLAGTDYARSGTLIGVAALAPASNLKAGLLYVYEQPAPFGDLGAFYALFSNGVFGGDPGIERAQIFKEEALRKYLADYDTKARAEMSLDPEWMNVAPTDIFQPQGGDAWTRYWAQVDDFNPEKKITVPIRVSQALGDTRVNPVNTTLLLTQLAAIDGHGPITPVTRVIVSQPDPKVLGAHFGLLMDDTEISGLVGWMGDRLTQPGPESS